MLTSLGHHIFKLSVTLGSPLCLIVLRRCQQSVSSSVNFIKDNLCVCLFASCCGTLIKSKRAWIELSLTGNPQHTYFIMTSLVKALNAPLYWARAFHIHLKESFWMVYVTLLSLSELQLASLFSCTSTTIGYAGKIVMTAFQMLLSRFII